MHKSFDRSKEDAKDPFGRFPYLTQDKGQAYKIYTKACKVRNKFGIISHNVEWRMKGVFKA